MHLLPLWLDKTWNRILLAFSILTGDKRESHGWNESKFRAIFDFANDGIQIIHDGVIVDCNDKMASLFGVGRQDIIGKTPACLSPADQLHGQKSIE